MSEEKEKELEEHITALYNILEANTTITNENMRNLLYENRKLKISVAFLKVGLVVIAAGLLFIALMFA